MYNDTNRLMISWWRTYSYFNNKINQIGDIEMITDAYVSSGLFWSRVRYNYIGHNAHTGRRSSFCSKPTPIHVLVHKSDLNYSYSIGHFSRLTQAVDKK